MNEILLATLAGCRARGLDGAALLRGAGITMSSLRNRWATTPWNAFADLMARVQEALGGPEQLEKFTAGMVRSSRLLRIAGGLVGETRKLYQLGAERIARRLCRNVGARIYPLSDGRIGYEAALPAGSRSSLAVWHALVGILRAYPTALGLVESEVTGQMEPLRARFVITPPPSRAPARRAAERLNAPLRTLLPGKRSAPEPSARELGDLAEIAFSDHGAAEISEIGPRLASHADGTAFGTEVAAVMRRLFCCGHVALWSYQSNGQQVLLHRQRGQSSERLTRVLHVDGRPVGRIEVDVMGLDGPSNPTFEALLPWIAIGLRWTRVAAASARNVAAHADRLRTFAQQCQLTTRQNDVLALLINGLSNREIADTLETSVKNVEIHVTNLLARAGVENRSRLISRFWQAGG